MPMQCKSTHNTRTPCTNTPPPSLGARQGFLPLYHQITTGPTWHSKGILQTLLAIHPPFALLLQQYIKPSVSELQSEGGWLLWLFPQHIWALQPGLGKARGTGSAKVWGASCLGLCSKRQECCAVTPCRQGTSKELQPERGGWSESLPGCGNCKQEQRILAEKVYKAVTLVEKA